MTFCFHLFATHHTMAATNPTDQLAPVEIHSDKKEPVGDVEADLKAGSVADLDDAELFLQQNGISHVRLAEMMQDEARLKKLRRKVDWTLMPLLCGTYLLQNIDKSAISYGAVFDLLSSTGTTGNQYSWLASLFYFAYLISEWPASYLVQRFRTGKIVAVFVIIWGCVLLCTAACRNFAGLAVCRFMLGIFEAVITPAFMLIVSQWFARDKQPARAGLFYCFNGVGLTVAGLLFFAVGQAKGMETWRIIFLLCGAATALWGVLLFFFLSDNILSATQFTIEERALLIAQNARGRSGVYNHNIKPYQIKEVFYDSQVWLLFFFVMLNEVMNGGLANFSGLIVEGFTHNALLTTVYGVPFGACTTIFMFTGPYMASKVKNVRTIVMALWVLPTLVAVSLFWKLPRSDKGGLLAGYYIVRSSPLNHG